MKTVRMVSTGSYLPGEPIDNDQMATMIGPLPAEVLEGIQVKTRHWMVDSDTGEHRERNSDMALKAIQQALDRCGLAADEVDFIGVSTASPDVLLPPMATLLQDRLGLRKCATLDVRSGCAGAVEVLDVARMYLERGQYRTAVVVGSETISPLLVPVFRGKDPESIRMRDRVGMYSFGDGAGAMVLRAFDDDIEGGGILASSIACVGGGKKPGMQVIGGGTSIPLMEQLAKPRLFELKVDVVESGRFTPFVLTEALTELCAAAGITPEQVDACVIPEGNATYMTDELEQAGLLTPEWIAIAPRIMENLALVGATGSAALPIALDHVWRTGGIKDGDLVMLLAIETSMWKYAGMVLPWTAGPCPV
jgi:3-oxoacyl-[acyl-carrier-protein] synthase-3